MLTSLLDRHDIKNILHCYLYAKSFTVNGSFFLSKHCGTLVTRIFFSISVDGSIVTLTIFPTINITSLIGTPSSGICSLFSYSMDFTHNLKSCAHLCLTSTLIHVHFKDGEKSSLRGVKTA